MLATLVMTTLLSMAIIPQTSPSDNIDAYTSEGPEFCDHAITYVMFCSAFPGSGMCNAAAECVSNGSLAKSVRCRVGLTKMCGGQCHQTVQSYCACRCANSTDISCTTTCVRNEQY